jgi:hypothetical protein
MMRAYKNFSLCPGGANTNDWQFVTPSQFSLDTTFKALNLMHEEDDETYLFTASANYLLVLGGER